MMLLNRPIDPSLKRQLFIIKKRENNLITVGQQSLINFSSSDYLCLASHPLVKKAFIQGIQTYGIGSGASAQVSGYFKPHHELTEQFAAFVKRDKAILFNSGYHANLGVITALAGKHTTILTDKLSHASIIDGIILSRATFKRYQHSDVAHLARLLDKISNHCIIVTESVFSIEGSIAPIKTIIEMTSAHQPYLIVDDAHGIGVLGKNGGGITEAFDLTQQAIPCLVTPLGKAFANMGALVSGSADLIDYLVQFARTHRYTIALPPAVAHASCAVLKVMVKENWRRDQLSHNIQFFIKTAKAYSLHLSSYDLTPIKSIVIGDATKAEKIRALLFNHDIFVACMRQPTVPVGKACIRISLNCLHTEAEIMKCLSLIKSSLHDANTQN